MSLVRQFACAAHFCFFIYKMDSARYAIRQISLLISGCYNLLISWRKTLIVSLLLLLLPMHAAKHDTQWSANTVDCVRIANTAWSAIDLRGVDSKTSNELHAFLPLSPSHIDSVPFGQFIHVFEWTKRFIFIINNKQIAHFAFISSLPRAWLGRRRRRKENLSTDTHTHTHQSISS